MTIRDNRDYIRVLSYSYYTTITGWGVLLRSTLSPDLGCAGEEAGGHDAGDGRAERKAALPLTLGG